MPVNIQTPPWEDCEEKLGMLEDSNLTVERSLRLGGELSPLEKIIHSWEPANSASAQQFREDVTRLVEWCINEPAQVIARHESLDRQPIIALAESEADSGE
jgi:hypothetical protein